MRTITCFGDQTSSTFLIFPSVSLAKITQSHGPITLWLWMFSTVLHLPVLPEIETCKKRRINRWNYRSPYLQYHPSSAGHLGWLYQVTFMALKYHSFDAPWSLGRKSVFCTFFRVLYRVHDARSAFYTWVRALFCSLLSQPCSIRYFFPYLFSS